MAQYVPLIIWSIKLIFDTIESWVQTAFSVRHIGNDNVQIIWSEHWRDYRTAIISSEFADVVICVNPIFREGQNTNLYRIGIIQKASSFLPFFGPLQDNTVITGDVLPLLVRETALNAARAVRSKIDGYRHFFEDRHSYLTETIRKLRVSNNSFEKFCTEVFRPSCGAEPRATPELSRRSRSDSQSDSGSVANSVQSSAFSVPYSKEHRSRTESHISDADLTPKIGQGQCREIRIRIEMFSQIQGVSIRMDTKL